MIKTFFEDERDTADLRFYNRWDMRAVNIKFPRSLLPLRCALTPLHTAWKADALNGSIRDAARLK